MFLQMFENAFTRFLLATTHTHTQSQSPEDLQQRRGSLMSSTAS